MNYEKIYLALILLVLAISNVLEQNALSEKTVRYLVKPTLNLAKLSQNLLKGEELTAFVKRSFDLIK